jgi:hypothetical protein
MTRVGDPGNGDWHEGYAGPPEFWNTPAIERQIAAEEEFVDLVGLGVIDFDLTIPLAEKTNPKDE